MSSRVRKQKFECGHTGLGKSCRRCYEAERFEALSETKPGTKGRKKLVSEERREATEKRPHSWLVDAACEKLAEHARYLAVEGKSSAFAMSTHMKITGKRSIKR